MPIPSWFSTNIPTIPCALPNLIELSITESGCQFKLPHRLPNLRRLHTDGSTDGVEYLNNAPVLEELRFTGITGSRPTMSNTLQVLDAVETHVGSVGQGGVYSGSVFPVTMDRLILQQCAPPYGAECGNPYMDHRDLARRLDRAAESTIEFRSTGKFHLVLLHMPTVELWVEGNISGLGYHFEDARRDWMEIVSGSGKGCWGDNLPAIEP